MFVTAILLSVLLVLFLNRKRLSPFRWVNAGHVVVLTGITGKQRVIRGSTWYSLIFEQETEVHWKRSIQSLDGTRIPTNQVIHRVGNHLYRSSVNDVLVAISHDDPWASLELELSILDKPTSSALSSIGKRYGLAVELARE